jgi:chemotaxis response regulator CheB
MRILVIEDVDSMRELLEQVVREMGKYQLSGSARNGAEARFELVRRRPDLVLLDEILPGESSFDLLDEFRSEGIPVVLLTSLKGRSAQEVPLPAGALGRIFKPEWRTMAADTQRIIQEIDQALASKG